VFIRDSGLSVVPIRTARVHQQPRIRRALGAQQVEAGRVAVEDLVTELAQEVDLLGIVVEHGGADAVGEEPADDYLPEASADSTPARRAAPEPAPGSRASG